MLSPGLVRLIPERISRVKPTDDFSVRLLPAKKGGVCRKVPYDRPPWQAVCGETQPCIKAGCSGTRHELTGTFRQLWPAITGRRLHH